MCGLIWGRIAFVNGTGLKDVSVNFHKKSCGTEQWVLVTFTDDNGTYEAELPNGVYRVTPELGEYIFIPELRIEVSQ